MDYDKYKIIAIDAAHRAGSLIVRNLGKVEQGDIDQKQSSDFVTRVDRQSETIIKDILIEAFPKHAFLAEESSRDQAGGYRWIIDPLDGTTNFIHGYPMFAVSIALEHEGQIIVGVIYDPLRDETFSATLGSGAYMNDRRIHASHRDDISACILATGFPFKQKHMLPEYLALFSRLFVRVSDIRRAGSAALDLAHLAAGRCDGFFELGLAPWDIAAGSLLITEAGGMITDFGGGDNFLETGNVIAGIPSTYNTILADTREVFSGIVNK